MTRSLLTTLVLAVASPLFCQTPVRPIPPSGVAVSDGDRAELEAGLQRLRASIEKLKANPLIFLLCRSSYVSYTREWRKLVVPH